MKKKKNVRGTLIALLCIALLVAFGILAFNSWSASRYQKYYQQSVETYCAQYNVDEYLVYAMIYAESGGDAQAVSRVGAVGAMQLMPKTAEWLCKREKIAFDEAKLTDADYNIRLGCAYIAYLCTRFNNNDCIIAAYNAGPNIVASWLEDVAYSQDGQRLLDVPYNETRRHIEKVNNAYSVYHKMYPPGA